MSKSSIENYFSFILTIVLVLFCSFAALAQTKQLTDSDKTQIIAAILRKQDFNDTEFCCDKNTENTIYLLAENISVEQIPKRNGIKFVLVTAAEVEEKRKTGFEYYSFGEFEIGKSAVQIYLSRTYSDTTARQGNGHTVEYTCRKVAGKWKVKGRLGSVYAS